MRIDITYTTDAIYIIFKATPHTNNIIPPIKNKIKSRELNSVKNKITPLSAQRKPTITNKDDIIIDKYGISSNIK